MKTPLHERIDVGSKVVGADGDHLGSVAYIVVDPTSHRLTDLIVSTGAILGRDVVVPIDTVDRVEGDTVHLTLRKNELDRCPDYVEIEYQTPPADWVPPMGLYPPATGVLWPTGGYDAAGYATPTEVKVNTPAGTVGVRAGLEVESSDGHKVGSIEGIDVRDDEIAAMIVKRGFLFTHDVRIPVDCVASIAEDKVVLSLTKDDVCARFEQKS